jgi:hypothetical protein
MGGIGSEYLTLVRRPEGKEDVGVAGRIILK